MAKNKVSPSITSNIDQYIMQCIIKNSNFGPVSKKERENDINKSYWSALECFTENAKTENKNSLSKIL